jgi:hypothetical protein
MCGDNWIACRVWGESLDEFRAIFRMTGRVAKTRQEPLGPDETFSALITRLITTNRTERAMRDSANKIGPTLQRVEPPSSEAPDGVRI